MTNTANLGDGFYWVRLTRVWEVAQRFYGRWGFIGSEETFEDEELEEIDPRPIKREDVK